MQCRIPYCYTYGQFTLCRACWKQPVCVAVSYPGTANILRNKRKSNPTAVLIFRGGRRSLICVRLTNKGKVGVQRGRETAGVPSFLPPRRAPQRPRRPQTANPPAEVQRKTSRPLGANPPAAVRVPRSAGAEKEPPRQGEHADAVRVPQSAGAEKSCRPDRANTLTQFECPAHPDAKKAPERVPFR